MQLNNAVLLTKFTTQKKNNDAVIFLFKKPQDITVNGTSYGCYQYLF